MRFTFGWAVLSLFVLTACPSEEATRDMPARAPRVQLALHDGSGAVIFKLVPRDDGAWNIQNAGGEKIGKVSVERDRVKVKDVSGTHHAKVEMKDRGFKIYDGADHMLFRGKETGARGLKVETPDAVVVGKLEGTTAQLGDRNLVASAMPDGTAVVKSAEVTVFEVRGGYPPEPVLLLGMEGSSVWQQAGLLIFFREVW